jgi:hypothetical protein
MKDTKRKLIKEKGTCEISGKELRGKPCLSDLNRIVPRSEGGGLEPENLRIVDPIENMKMNGTLRVREPHLEKLKCIIDDREQIRKLYQKIANQLLAYKRKTDNLQSRTVEFLETELENMSRELKDRDKQLKTTVTRMAITNALVKAALGVKGVGPITVAYCMVYLDFKIARHASCFWSYAGLAKPSYERYTKGQSSGGNKNLRTALYTMADSMMKTRGAYRKVYDDYKNRLENSDKITKSRNTQGQLIECAWKDTKPGHRHSAALRVIMKHFLADFWRMGRIYYDLPVDVLYPEAMLGPNHRTIMPEERGWALEATHATEYSQQN